MESSGWCAGPNGTTAATAFGPGAASSGLSTRGAQSWSPSTIPREPGLPESTVGIGGPCLYVYPTPTGGGYQLFGRTIPIFQFAQKHPLFKESPTFFKAGDRIRFHEVTEPEILDIHRRVHELGEYEYDIKPGKFVVKDWLEFYNAAGVQQEVKELLAKQEAGTKIAPKV